MDVKILVKDIYWDVPEELLGLEPLDDNSSVEDIIRYRYSEIPQKVKELYPELPNDAEVTINIDEDDLNEDGTIYPGVLAGIINYKLLDEYNYGAYVMGEFIFLEGKLEISEDE